MMQKSSEDKKSKRDLREQRLARQLRANLRKRKAQDCNVESDDAKPVVNENTKLPVDASDNDT
ncbi:MAG: hypothetical protein AAF228_03445 [Pseudomonadota bacterium]